MHYPLKDTLDGAGNPRFPLLAKGFLAGLFFSALLTPAYAQMEWHRVSPVLDAHAYTSVAFLVDKLVALAENGLVLTSWDGVKWETHTSGMSSHPRLLAALGNRLLAIGEAGSIHTTEDGFNWTGRQTGSNAELKSVAWNGETAVVVGESGTVLLSRDGTSWQRGNIKTDHALTAVVWAGSRFVAANDNFGLFASVDGLDWNEIGTPSTGWNYSLYWTGTELLAAGGSFISSTSDFANWTLRSHSLGSSNPFNLFSCASSGSRYIAANGQTALLTSPNGHDWSTIRTPNVVRSVLWSGTQFVGVGDAGLILTSPDGAVFTDRRGFALEAGYDPRGTPLDASLNSLAASESLFVAVASNGQAIRSKDGTSWSKPDSISPYILRKVIWTGTRFIALDDHDGLMSSPDGREWSQLKQRTAPSITDFIWTGKEFYAVNGGTSILHSADGAAWSEQTKDLYQASFNSIAWDGKEFIAGGSKLLTSMNGTDWDAHSRTGYEDAGIGSIACKEHACVATGFGGIAYSRDTTWQLIDGTYDKYGRPNWLKDLFVLPSDHGIRHSENGSEWTLVRTTGVVKEVARLGNRLVGVGGKEIWVSDIDSATALRPKTAGGEGPRHFSIAVSEGAVEFRLPGGFGAAAFAAIYTLDGKLVSASPSKTQSGMLRLSSSDLGRGLYVAVARDRKHEYKSVYFHGMN